MWFSLQNLKDQMETMMVLLLYVTSSTQSINQSINQSTNRSIKGCKFPRLTNKSFCVLCFAAVCLNLWDTAGQNRFRQMNEQYLPTADAVILLYDVRNVQTLKDCRRFVDDVQRFCHISVVKILGTSVFWFGFLFSWFCLIITVKFNWIVCTLQLGTRMTLMRVGRRFPRLTAPTWPGQWAITSSKPVQRTIETSIRWRCL